MQAVPGLLVKDGAEGGVRSGAAGRPRGGGEGLRRRASAAAQPALVAALGRLGVTTSGGRPRGADRWGDGPRARPRRAGRRGPPAGLSHPEPALGPAVTGSHPNGLVTADQIRRPLSLNGQAVAARLRGHQEPGRALGLSKGACREPVDPQPGRPAIASWRWPRRRPRWWCLPLAASAAPGPLTITPLGWNVIGLDSNDVTVGPNVFPIGARVCNTGSDPVTNVAVDWSVDCRQHLRRPHRTPRRSARHPRCRRLPRLLLQRRGHA